MNASRFWMICALLLASSTGRGESQPADISEFQDELMVLEAPNGHYLVTALERMRWRTFWGDSKVVYKQHGIVMSDHDGEPGNYTEVDSSFYDSRFDGLKLSWVQGSWSLRCGKEDVKLKQLSAQESDAFVDRVEFRERYWTRKPILLARDEYGTYFLVDEGIYDKSAENYHIYTGWMGNMVRSKMHLVAKDSEGSIFSTRSGDRRLIMDDEMYRFVEDEISRPLRKVPVDENWEFIHRELGAYAGMTQGTPCDLF
jgi:hypothetical protein